MGRQQQGSSTRSGGFRHPSAWSFLAAAKDFLEGALRLKDHPSQGLTAAFLFGFVVELALKSYIVHARIKAPDDDTLFTHNLVTLWDWAATGSDFPLQATPPDWLANVSSTHTKFLIRYRPWDIHGWILPGPTHYQELQSIVDSVSILVPIQPPPAVNVVVKTQGSGTYVPPDVP